jgi:curved DNA-binding protein CbpA
VRIPLDYYRILGLPIQASVEQLQQAYRDRTLQLPRREYSETAIVARKQLLEAAYAVLSDPEQRSRYDANYFAHNYESDADNPAESIAETLHAKGSSEPSDPIKPSELFPAAVDPHTPSIEIADELFVGALLILQELGEYELVLKVGRPYLSTSSVTAESEQSSEPDQVLSDIVLTVALACLELGREQWQQDQYEDAATSLSAGEKLLLSQEKFERVRGEIQADLYKLRPYRILELLARSEDNLAERRQSLNLLQDMLSERGGIDGTGDDWSGLSLDDFLRFIQQLRSYLTAAEQQSLFEAESQRPSAVATYLAVYALIARGFAQRLPALIRQARLLLMHLGKRQDLSLEQAVCSLLLGQTEAASRALELSQEYEALAFIQEHSQGFPDLLPGLCLYGERWLQTEVFPHFRDLAQQQASLKDYFADEQVQAYLEALPTQEATNEWTVVPPQSLTHAQATRSRQSNDPALVSQSGSTSMRERRGRDTARSKQTPTYQIAAGDGESATSSQTATAAPNATLALKQSTTSPDASDLTKVQISPQRSRRRSRSQLARSLGVLNGETLSYRQVSGSTWAFKNILEAKKTRLVLLVFAGMLGISVLGFLMNQTYAWLRQTFFPTPLLQGEQLLVQLDRPPLPIPDPSDEVLTKEELLNQKTAEQVVQTWLSTKAAAFGSNHAVDRLEQILVAPTLSQWQRLAQKDKADKRYRQYKHSLKVDSVQTSEANPNKAQVEAIVSEVAKLYEDGQLNQGSSYDENLRVRYDLVRKNGQWRIREMKVLK